MSLTNEILYEMIRDKGFTPVECRNLVRVVMDEVRKERESRRMLKAMKTERKW